MTQDNKHITTIKLEKETKERLDKLKSHPRETYEELIKKVLGILNICKLDPEKARSKLRQIDKARVINKVKQD